MFIKTLSQLNTLYANELNTWNSLAERILVAMTNLEQHGLYAIYMPETLRKLNETYIALTALQKAGADTKA